MGASVNKRQTETSYMYNLNCSIKMKCKSCGADKDYYKCNYCGVGIERPIVKDESGYSLDEILLYLLIFGAIGGVGFAFMYASMN